MKDMHTQPHWTCMHTCTDFSAVTIKNVNCQLTGDTFLLNGAPRRPLLLSGGGVDDDDGEAGNGIGGTRGRHDARRLVGAGCGEGGAAGCGKGGVSLSLKENQKLVVIPF
jgi:hypothetical protein